MRNIFSSSSIAVLALSLPLAALAQPTISQIQNNYSYLVSGQPNYGIAPGTLFIVIGTGMASTTTVTSLQSSAPPGLPTSLNGCSVSVTVGGVTTHPAFYYAEATQIALVLPAATPVGTGTLMVTFGGQSASAPITVLQSALGFDTLYGSGTGLGVVTPNNSATVLNYNNSAAPGDVVVLWGSGLGADTADSDTVFTSTPHAVNVPLQIFVGGLQAAIAYQGASGYPGVNQIDITIPAGVQPGCAIAVAAVSGSIVSNTITIPVSSTRGICSDPLIGSDTGDQILNLAGKGIYNDGSINLEQAIIGTTVQNIVSADFETKQGSDAGSGVGYVSVGNCITGNNGSGGSNFNSTALDAGTMTITGPAGTLNMTETSLGSYALKLPAGFVPTAGGSFTFNATGGTTKGASVGAFSTSLSVNAPLVWTNMSAITAINRAQGQAFTWTGGAANSFVIIEGASNGGTATVGFTCFAASSAGQFTVPAYVLAALPAGSGSVELGSETASHSFSATGLDQGTINGLAGGSINVPFN